MCRVWRGKKGGLSEYARQVGKDRKNLSRYQEAAETYSAINLGNVTQVLDKANHLAAIHKAPSADWAWLVGELSEGGRGKKGGLSEYARQVGKGKQTLSDNKQAATVFRKLSGHPDSLLDKANHLAAIHKAGNHGPAPGATAQNPCPVRMLEMLGNCWVIVG